MKKVNLSALEHFDTIYKEPILETIPFINQEDRRKISWIPSAYVKR